VADHLQIAVSVIPVEELTDEDSNTIKITSGEVGTNLAGSGDSVDLANYGSSNQGYLNGAVVYLDAVHTDVGAALVTATRDCVFVRNTGFKFSSSTVLGDATTDCVMVVLREVAFVTSTTGGYENAGDSKQIHHYEVAWLKPGQAFVLIGGATKNSINQFGGNSFDLSPIGQTGNAGESKVYVRTYLSNGDDASDGNAVEYLSVT